MFSNFLKLTLRSLYKNRIFVLINVIGLGTALACCIVAFLNWDYNQKFDTHHVHADEIYRINFIRITNGQPIPNGSCPMPLGAIVRESVPQVTQVIRYLSAAGNFKVGNEVFNTSIGAVDPQFFEAFTFPMLSGSAASITDKSNILISEKLQQLHFPDNPDPSGRILTYLEGDRRIDFRVGGVFKEQPQNSSFQSEAFIHYDNILDINDWNGTEWFFFNTTFLRIPNPADVPVVEEELQKYIEIQNRAKKDYKVDSYYLDPFVGMAVRAEQQDLWNHWFNSSLPTAAAVAPGIMALLILLIACFNFTNTSIAIANRRIKEIGVRKVLGSGRKQLIAQFLGENLILTFIALLAGVGIASFLVPAYNAMWAFLDIELDLLGNPQLLVFLVLLLLFTSFLAGSYPAFYVSGFQPTAIFRGSVKFSGTNLIMRVLLTLQFAISLIGIICGIVFSQNARYQYEYDLGFDNNVVYAFVKDQSGFEKMRNALQDYNQVKSIAGSNHHVTSARYSDPVRVDMEELDVVLFDVGAGYLETIGATLLEGRDFREQSASDARGSIIVNEELVRTFGWENPIGQRVVLRDTIALNVIGVVRDIYVDGALWDPLDPMVMRYSHPEQYRFISVRTDSASVSAVKSLMDEKWKEIFPDELSRVRALDRQRAESAEVNLNIKDLFLFLGVVAVFLSVIGLFSLVSLNLVKRMKEIGIRKILGASLENITLHMSREFLWILAIASVLGAAAGYFLANMLMASIWTYYITISPAIIIVSIALLFIIGCITIGTKVVRAATVDPATMLRDD